MSLILSETSGIDASLIGGRVRPEREDLLVRSRGRLRVLGGDRSEDPAFVNREDRPETDPVVRSCVQRWQHGVPWEETESYRHDFDVVARATQDPERKREKIRTKHSRLDAIYQDAKRDGLDSRRQHRVWMSLAHDGVLLAGPNGRHRIAMALILGVPLPVVWLVIHPVGIVPFKNTKAE